MREILFRGQWLNDNTLWVEGNLVKNFETGNCFINTKRALSNDYCMLPVVPETVGQYTGLTDKQGVKVFEGDILDGSWATPQDPMRFAVKWYSIHAGFNIIGLNMLAFEVIGNIHDNPELLEGKE